MIFSASIFSVNCHILSTLKKFHTFFFKFDAVISLCVNLLTNTPLKMQKYIPEKNPEMISKNKYLEDKLEYPD